MAYVHATNRPREGRNPTGVADGSSTEPAAPATAPLSKAQQLWSTPSNHMPHHSRNVHAGAVQPFSTYTPYAAGTQWRRCPYLPTTVMRVVLGNAPFELTNTIRSASVAVAAAEDTTAAASVVSLRAAMQSLFATLVRMTGAGDLAASAVRVQQAIPTAGGRYVRVTLEVDAKAVEGIKEVIRCGAVLMDRHGFHVAHSVDDAVTLASYCAAIRGLPQKRRHYVTDGLPCSPLQGFFSNATGAAAAADEETA